MLIVVGVNLSGPRPLGPAGSDIMSSMAEQRVGCASDLDQPALLESSTAPFGESISTRDATWRLPLVERLTGSRPLEGR